MADGESKNRREYDELKAKLGLKTTKDDAESKRTTDNTPPGGFDLGLEHSGAELALETEGASALDTDGSGALVIARSGASRMAFYMVVLLGLGGMFGLGFYIKATMSARQIEKFQWRDASALIKKLKKVKTEEFGTCKVLLSKCSDDAQCKTGCSAEAACKCQGGQCHDYGAASAECKSAEQCKKGCPDGARCACDMAAKEALHYHLHTIRKLDGEIKLYEDAGRALAGSRRKLAVVIKQSATAAKSVKAALEKKKKAEKENIEAQKEAAAATQKHHEEVLATASKQHTDAVTDAKKKDTTKATQKADYVSKGKRFDAAVKRLEKALMTTRTEAESFLKKKVRLKARTFIGTAIFNGKAVGLILALAENLDKLYYRTEIFKNRCANLGTIDPLDFAVQKSEVPSLASAWHIMKSKETIKKATDEKPAVKIPRASLSEVELLKDKDGTVERKLLVLVPSAEAVKKDNRGRVVATIKKDWAYKIRFKDQWLQKKVNERFKCDQTPRHPRCDWAATDSIVELDHKGAIIETVQTVVSKKLVGLSSLALEECYNAANKYKESGGALRSVFETTIQRLEQLSGGN